MRPLRRHLARAQLLLLLELLLEGEVVELPIACFYGNDVQFNYLAELTRDANPGVRLRVSAMIGHFLTQLMDRYDHQTRLLPYLLNCVIDEVAETYFMMIRRRSGATGAPS